MTKAAELRNKDVAGLENEVRAPDGYAREDRGHDVLAHGHRAEHTRARKHLDSAEANPTHGLAEERAATQERAEPPGSGAAVDPARDEPRAVTHAVAARRNAREIRRRQAAPESTGHSGGSRHVGSTIEALLRVGCALCHDLGPASSATAWSHDLNRREHELAGRIDRQEPALQDFRPVPDLPLERAEDSRGKRCGGKPPVEVHDETGVPAVAGAAREAPDAVSSHFEAPVGLLQRTSGECCQFAGNEQVCLGHIGVRRRIEPNDAHARRAQMTNHLERGHGTEHSRATSATTVGK